MRGATMADKPKQRSPKAEAFLKKAAECYQLAENANFTDTRDVYRRLALSYERLAKHAENDENEACYPPDKSA